MVHKVNFLSEVGKKIIVLGSFKGSLTRDFQLVIDTTANVNIFAPHPVPAYESTMKGITILLRECIRIF